MRSARLRVLVADDSASLRLVVRITIESQGWSVVEATTGAEALVIANAQQPDLILLDLDFADGDLQGPAVLQRLRSSSETADIPVIVLTASDRQTDETESVRAGAAAYVRKPFGPLDLIEVMGRVVGDALRGAGLGLYLVDAGALTAAQLDRALARQRERAEVGEHVALGVLLVEQGAISESELNLCLTQQRAQAIATASGRSAPHAPAPATVLIVDDHRAVREGLRALLAGTDLRVVGEAVDGQEALRLSAQLRPTLVILDQQMPGLPGLDVLERLRTIVPETKVVMFTMSREVEGRARDLGASAFVAKDSPNEVLLGVLRDATRSTPVPTMPPTAAPARARFHSVRRGLRWRSLALLGAILASYLVGFLVAEPVLGPSAAIVAIVPVALAGALLGPELGVLAAIAVDLLTFQLWEFTGHQAGETLFQIRGNGLGALSLLFLGAAFGAMRLPADRSRSRDAALGHAITNPGGPVELLVAVRSIVPCDGAVLLRLTPDRFEVELVQAVGIDAFPTRVALSGAPVLARCVRELAPVITQASLPGISTEVRAVAAVPILSGSGRVLGILALLDRQASAFGERDAMVVQALALAAAELLESPAFHGSPARARGVSR